MTFSPFGQKPERRRESRRPVQERRQGSNSPSVPFRIGCEARPGVARQFREESLRPDENQVELLKSLSHGRRADLSFQENRGQEGERFAKVMGADNARILVMV